VLEPAYEDLSSGSDWLDKLTGGSDDHLAELSLVLGAAFNAKQVEPEDYTALKYILDRLRGLIDAPSWMTLLPTGGGRKEGDDVLYEALQYRDGRPIELVAGNIPEDDRERKRQLKNRWGRLLRQFGYP
jgi:hypothetical protein